MEETSNPSSPRLCKADIERRTSNDWLRRDCCEDFFVPGADQLRDITARERGWRQSAARLHPLAGHVEIFQSRERLRKTTPQNLRCGEPALVAALPVAGPVFVSGRRRQVGLINVPRKPRKSLIQNTYDLVNQLFFCLPIIGRTLVLEFGPMFVIA